MLRVMEGWKKMYHVVGSGSVHFPMHLGSAWIAAVVILSLCPAILCAQLSHEGIYVNLPHRSSLRVYVDRALEAVDEASVTVTSPQHRTLPEVQACRWRNYSGLEACEQLDLHHTWANTSYPVSHKDIHPDGGIVVPGDPLEALRNASATPILRSMLVEWHPKHGLGRPYHKRWWVGHVSLPDQERAKWPIGPGEYVSRGGVPNKAPVTPWDGKDMPRISGGTCMRLRRRHVGSLHD